MMNPSIPFFAITPPEAVGMGSACVLRHGSDAWLLSAAHVPLPIDQQPHPRWDEWPTEASVYTTLENTYSLPLFDGAPRTPKFKYVDGTPRIGDIMALPLDEVTLHELRDYRAFTVADIGDAKEGDEIEAFGYPLANPWPASAVSRHRAAIESNGWPLIRFRPNGRKGFSGGPVLDLNGNLVGVLIGHDDGLGAAVSARWIAHDFLQLPVPASK